MKHVGMRGFLSRAAKWLKNQAVLVYPRKHLGSQVRNQPPSSLPSAPTNATEWREHLGVSYPWHVI